MIGATRRHGAVGAGFNVGADVTSGSTTINSLRLPNPISRRPFATYLSYFDSLKMLRLLAVLLLML